MIIDQFGVFFDDAAATATMTSTAKRLMPYAGREDPIFVTVLARGANAASATYTVKVQQAGDNGTFADVASYHMVKPNAAPAMQAFRLPEGVWKKDVRLVITVSGTPAGTVFAAVTRDHFAPYAEGLYIDGGEVRA